MSSGAERTDLLVTGGSGFIGQYFLKAACQAWGPQRLVLLTRSGSPPPGFEDLEIVPGDLSKPLRLRHNFDTVFHLAGEKADESRMWEVNRDGTERLIAAAAQNGVRRFVYLSSVGVYGIHGADTMVTENTPTAPKNEYERSKLAAEEIVRDVCPQLGLEWVIFRPSNVVGVHTGRARPLLGMLRAIKSGRFSFVGPGDAVMNYVAVEDVASAILTGLDAAATNRSFIINTPLPLRDFVKTAADILNVPVPTGSLPTPVSLLAAKTCDVVSRLTGTSLPYSSGRHLELTSNTLYDGAALTKVTRFAYPYGIRRGIETLVRHYQAEGLL